MFMNIKIARKTLPHRLNDVLNCLKYRRFLRLHLVTVLVMESIVVIEKQSRDSVESGFMVDLRVALLKKDSKRLNHVLKIKGFEIKPLFCNYYIFVNYCKALT